MIKTFFSASVKVRVFHTQGKCSINERYDLSLHRTTSEWKAKLEDPSFFNFKTYCKDTGIKTLGVDVKIVL